MLMQYAVATPLRADDMTITKSKLPITLLAGLSLVGGLAGCSATVAEDPAPPAPPVETEPDAGGDAGASGSYADGTYSAAGEYQAPSGTETVDVTVTLAAGVITEVTVVGESEDAQARGYQERFSSGIGAVVVSKGIDEIQVDKVGGSSLTGAGFNTAIEAIKAEAAS